MNALLWLALGFAIYGVLVLIVLACGHAVARGGGELIDEDQT